MYDLGTMLRALDNAGRAGGAHGRSQVMSTQGPGALTFDGEGECAQNINKHKYTITLGANYFAKEK